MGRKVIEHTGFFGNCGTVILNLWCGAIIRSRRARLSARTVEALRVSGWRRPEDDTQPDFNALDCMAC